MTVTSIAHLTDRDIAAFWRKVDRSSEPNGCWVWNGGRDAQGYGVFSRTRVGEPRVAMRAHRMAYILTNGEPSPDAPLVRHRCDNPPCVRPDHLEPGTAGDNARDIVVRGRHWTATRPEDICRGDRHWSRRRPERVPRGEAHGGARLTEAQVREIRSRYPRPGVTQRSLAAEYGVSQGLIWQIVTRRVYWRDV